MDSFNAAQFRAEFATETGRRLWSFLNRDEIVARMETASDLGQPALQAIEDQLLGTFGDAIMADRYKQMIGRMVRQILESRGFEHVTSDVRLNSVPFYKASRYRRRDQATVYVFRNSTNPRDLYVSTARNPVLPVLERGRWVYVNALTSGLKAEIGYGFNLKDAVKRASFRHLVTRVMRTG